MKAFAKFLQKSLIVYWLAVVHIKHADGFGFCCMDHNKNNHDRVSSVQLIYTVDYGKKDLWTVFHKDVSKRLTQSVECEIYLENTRKEWEKFKFSNALSQYRNLVITVACFCNMSDICHESPETFADFVSHLPDEEATFYKNNVLPAIKPPFKQDEPEPTDTTKYVTTSFAITHESPEVTTTSRVTEVQVHHNSPTATTKGEEPPIEVPHDDKYRRETPPPQEDDLQSTLVIEVTIATFALVLIVVTITTILLLAAIRRQKAKRKPTTPDKKSQQQEQQQQTMKSGESKKKSSVDTK